MNVQPHNSTRPSVVTGTTRKTHYPDGGACPSGCALCELAAYKAGVAEGRRQASQAAHPAGFHRPTHGGHCG